MKPCALVPVYDQHARLAEVLAGLRAQQLPLLLVDDGSGPETRRALDAFAAADPALQLVSHPVNRGKGAAVATGLAAAAAAGYTHAVQVDADGQHDLAALPELLARARAEPAALVSGAPRYDASMPRARRYGRWVTHVWVWIETLSRELVDSMCGFRVYPVAATRALIAAGGIGERMEFDTALMVRWYWTGRPVRFVPVAVIYPADNVSHFRPWRDNLRISAMHARLFFGMLPRIPRLLWRREDARDWASTEERGSMLGIRVLATLALLGGRRLTALVLWPVAAWYAATDRAARAASRDFLARVHPLVAAPLRAVTRPTAANVVRHIHSFACLVVDKLLAWRDPRLTDEVGFGERDPRTLLPSNGGALLIGSHHGNLELCRALAARLPGLRVKALVYAANAARFVAEMQRANPSFGVDLIYVEHMGVDTAIALRNMIEGGDVVVIVGDRTPVDPSSATVSVPFLGAPAPFAIGPWVLGHVLECPVLLLHCLRQPDGRYHLELEPFRERIRLPRATRDAALRELVTDYAQRLEAHVVRAPLQWGNLYDFWAPRTPAPALEPG